MPVGQFKCRLRVQVGVFRDFWASFDTQEQRFVGLSKGFCGRIDTLQALIYWAFGVFRQSHARVIGVGQLPVTRLE